MLQISQEYSSMKRAKPIEHINEKHRDMNISYLSIIMYAHNFLVQSTFITEKPKTCSTSNAKVTQREHKETIIFSCCCPKVSKIKVKLDVRI